MSLRDILEAERRAKGLSMEDLTVLADDPFRLDTPANRRDARWAAGHLGSRTLHGRGLHYIVLGQTKPDGTTYANTEKDWKWCLNSLRTARWLRYVDFEQVPDQRNRAPVVRLHEPQDPEGKTYYDPITVIEPTSKIPFPRLDGTLGVQPFRIALWTEKVSLEAVLDPLATEYGCDLLLPTGESSDTMIHALAKVAAEDGRPLIVLYFADCDMSGYQMSTSVAWKLRAFKDLLFPDLDYQVRPAMLTVDQVKNAESAWGITLPSSPLKPTDPRRDAWKRATGIDQVEIDSVATLHPGILERLAREAIERWYDVGLAQRVRAAQEAWETAAREAIRARLGDDYIAYLEQAVDDALVEINEKVDDISDLMTPSALNDVALPDEPDQIVGDVNGDPESPIAYSGWSLADQARVLKDRKAYRL